MLDNILITILKGWSQKRRNWLANLINIADFEIYEQPRYEDVTEEYMNDLSRLDKEDLPCACGNIKLPESNFCRECI